MARSAYSILRGICIRLIGLLASRCGGHRATPTQNPLNVLRHHVALDIHLVARLADAHGGDLECVRDQLATETTAADREHCKRNSIDCDGAFFDQVARFIRWNLEGIEL